ncbi:MAG: hypothetical protein SLAVMIC_00392 [uncultured marine phage]|uniref:Uncharacterized protein n=1 Tax=uncultured marine phage TaxID=707152 RepID=A0A8D9CC08_9VIRU|nr:MAG: hypothetical protein SLAVMIC_00392 [uncultured marine phage]
MNLNKFLKRYVVIRLIKESSINKSNLIHKYIDFDTLDRASSVMRDGLVYDGMEYSDFNCTWVIDDVTYTGISEVESWILIDLETDNVHYDGIDIIKSELKQILKSDLREERLSKLLDK